MRLLSLTPIPSPATVQPQVQHLAELGVVFLLFVIGLELSLERLQSMAKYVFGMGAAQVRIQFDTFANTKRLVAAGYPSCFGCSDSWQLPAPGSLAGRPLTPPLHPTLHPQTVLTLLGVAGTAMAVAGLAGPSAIILGGALAMSTTAVAIQVLEDRGEMGSRHGRATFSVLLFQVRA